MTAPRSRFLVGLVVWLVSALYVLPYVHRGWVPHDEGVLGQSAERVESGELPQRDFDDVYTGGLSFLHALGFRLLGTRLASLRLLLLAVFLAFVPALYAVALRFARPVAAGTLTFLGVVWSVPNYFASMPSWYHLFLATFCAFALLRQLETGGRRWLFLAGLCAGAALLIKLHGLFLLASVLLFLVYREQETFRERGGSGEVRGWGFPLLKGVGLLTFAALLWRLVSNRPAAMEYLHFFVPGAAVCAFLLWSEFRERSGTLRLRGTSFLRLLLPFLAGAAAPIVLFLVPYVASGGLEAFWRGLLAQSDSRLTNRNLGVWLPGIDTFASGLVYGGVLLFASTVVRAPRRGWITAGAAALAIGLLLFSGNSAVYREVFQSARSLGALAVVAGCLLLVRGTISNGLPSEQRQKIFLVTAVAAMAVMVQFPFAAPIYFCFAAPLVAMLVLAVAEAEPRSVRGVHRTALLFYLCFGVLRLNVGYVSNLGLRFERYRVDGDLDPVRGGLEVPEDDRAAYTSLVALIRQKTGGGSVFAGPDCPEVYFLSNRPNLTRSLIDFLGGPRPGPGVVLRLLREKGIAVVVVNRRPDFSPAVSDPVLLAIRSDYPQSRDIGQFTVFWRE